MSAIHQFVPMLHRDDAVGRHTLRLRDVLVARGIESRIYVEMVDPETEAETSLFPRYADEAQRGDVLLYQFATASAMAPWLAERRETLVVNYHNVTPPEYYAAWNNPMARHQLRALHERATLAPRTGLGIAVSAFNEAELRTAGYARTAVVPPAAVAPTSGCRRTRCWGTLERRCALDLRRPRRAQQGDRARRHGAARHPCPPRS